MGLFGNKFGNKKKTAETEGTERCDYCNGTTRTFAGAKCWSCNGVGNKVTKKGGAR